MSDGTDLGRRRFLGGAATTIAASRLGGLGFVLQQLACAARSTPATDELSSLRGATAWLNTTPLTVDHVGGKVVLVEFCTFTCINWLRALPYTRAWAERYRDRGLVVIGAHTPEFSFEHDLENVRRAVAELRIEHPIAVDNDYAIWRGFGNRYWPAVYLIDARGHLRHHQFGEGDYDRTEAVIRELLGEAGVDGLARDPVSVEATGVELAADWGNLRSPETYLGFARTDRFASPGGAVADDRHLYTAPAQLNRNEWALSGDWTIGPEAVVLHRAGGRIAHRFHARDLHLVMGPAVRGATVRFRVRVEGQPPGAAAGLDVDESGAGSIGEQRMYQLVRQPGPIADREFEIELLDPGVAAFAFTFG